MAQFDVDPHPLEELRDTHPYVVQVQSHFLKRPATVMAVPLAPLGTPQHASMLNPIALNEEQGAQSHFLDLCELLGVPKPGSAEGYRFEEKNAGMLGKTGYADVFMRGVFA